MTAVRSYYAGLDRGETFIVTRRGVAVGELIPIRRHRFASRVDVGPGVHVGRPDRPCALHPRPGSARQPGRRTTWLTRFHEGSFDTSVVIALRPLDSDRLPEELAVSALTMAELAAGPHAADDPAERARRQDRLRTRRFCSIHCRSTPRRLVPMDSSTPPYASQSKGEGTTGRRPADRCYGAGPSTTRCTPETATTSGSSAASSRSSRSDVRGGGSPVVTRSDRARVGRGRSTACTCGPIRTSNGRCDRAARQRRGPAGERGRRAPSGLRRYRHDRPRRCRGRRR